jgi:hypothetical protein
MSIFADLGRVLTSLHVISRPFHCRISHCWPQEPAQFGCHGNMGGRIRDQSKRGVVGLLRLAAAVALSFAVTEPAWSAEDQDWPWITWSSFDRVCDGECGVAVYGGTFLETDMREVFGGLFGANRFTPPHEFDFNDDGIVAAAISRRFANFAGVIDFEAEAGVAQRFGEDTESEVWAAFYARWTYFPWNRWIRTTMAVSTGLNYASSVSQLELAQGRAGASGSKLLNFLSPELTLALPEAPNTELLFRLHHRSGGREIVGNIPYFNGTGGASQYLTVGLRRRF